MSTVAVQSLLRQTLRPSTLETEPFLSRNDVVTPFSVNFKSKKKRIRIGGNAFCFNPKNRSFSLIYCASKSTNTHADTSQNNNQSLFSNTFKLQTIQKVDGRLNVKLQKKDKENWELQVGCSLPGKWILHWGVHYAGALGSEWDQPPQEMRPPGSIVIKDYAIETQMKKSSASENGQSVHEVKIGFNCRSNIAAINFVLKDKETGSWIQHRGRDFMVPLVDYLRDRDNFIGEKKGLNLLSGKFGQLFKAGGPERASEDITEAPTGYVPEYTLLEEFDEQQHLIKEIPVYSSLTVSVKECPDTFNKLVYLETDIPGNVVVHWGVCSGRNKKWEVPDALRPLNTDVFKNKALRTRLQKKEGCNSETVFTFGEETPGFAFVLKVNDETWLNHQGDDFFVPLSEVLMKELKSSASKSPSRSVEIDEKSPKEKQETHYTTFTEGIIRDIKDLVTDLSSGTNWKTGSKESQESVLREIEKLAAEAYSIFRTTTQDFSEEAEKESQVVQTPATIVNSGTGSGYEILCQGFNWESHKSGKWYMELQGKAAELASLGFTVIWLPPPTDSVSPEGYMPKDLYNLNSRYGSFDELKRVVEKLHEVGIKVLGDVVLNHRCAEFQNASGVWNIFGGPLNWDDRAVVGDDPHFAGKGNKSSGDNFHAAPNIDHSQDFVRRDIKAWLRWLRKDVGYDGWRLDFVRGFWGGYVNDYIDSSAPYFAVGEFWDSLTYTYGEMDYDQDPHRQRIIDWINAAGGTSGAFDVTTKGILHSVLERCEYWRLSDAKGKPPGVVGWWPSRAVTFIENHDTGSTQGHWRFPSGREMQGYAYILTHPGTPSVFYDHIFSHYQAEISALISLRTRKQLHCRSSVKIATAKRDVYAAVIDEKVAMKIGPGHYEPPNGPQKWSLAIEGRDYKVWEAK